MVEIINKDIFKGVAGKRSGKPKGVVIHNDAGSKNATAKWYMTTFLPDRVKAKQSNLGFAHYYIDRNTIGRCENTNNKAWHVGQSDGNANYIGFEVCQSIGESEANFRLNEEMTFRQVAEDLQFYGLPANRDTVKLHKQFSSTSCPHRSVALHGDNTKVQDYFIARVKHYMSLGKTVAEMLKKDNQIVVSKPVAKPVAKPQTKSIETLVAETKAGVHKNGDARKKSLGSNYNAVMDIINGKNKPKAVTKKFNLPDTEYWVKKPQFSGSGVLVVQNALSSIYFYPNKGAKNNGCDSYYGPKTADTVKRFQSVYGLKADGIYGDATRKKLDSLVNK